MTIRGGGAGAQDDPAVVTVSSWGSLWLVDLSGTSEGYWGRLRSRSRMKVVELVWGPGRVQARAVDRRGELHLVDIEIRRLSSGERDDVTAAAARRSGTLATLLDGSIPSVLVDEVADLEIDLFPTPTDIRISCGCDEWSEPCAHAAAVLRSVADAMDRDPFLLFELRGLPRAEMLTAIRGHRGSGTAGTTPTAVTEPEVDPWDGWSVDSPVRGPGPWSFVESQTDDHPDDTTTSSGAGLGEDCSAARRDAVEQARALLRRMRPPRPDPTDVT